MMKVLTIVACVLFLQGCIHKIVTVPVKVAYKTTKGVVKGTTAVVGAIIPDGEEDSDSEKKKD
ncbi:MULTISPECIES: NF038104 family lipoprotein [unclassified Acinetobacter]|uniref:NF038104 family lipoprotein n=1 Tax=unclassified Acinetobacter TaxID=196816 RepID=UPI001217B52E|nr:MULTISPECIES: NF038104 family lipoprotein [unclassified Acinetobacter]RZJ24058.1 MAG: hypothetical protein EON51_01390 [Acinetobacter sp.]